MSPDAQVVAASAGEPVAESIVPSVTDEQLSELPVSEEWPEAAAAPMDDPGDELEPDELEGDEQRLGQPGGDDGVVDDAGGERTSA